MSPFDAPDAAARVRVLGGNEPLALTGQQVWLVRSGSIAIFARSGRADTDAGLRRFVFSVGAGGAILWAVGDAALTAVPTERSELIPAPLVEEAAAIAGGDRDATTRFVAWLGALSAEISAAGVEIPASRWKTDRTAAAVVADLEMFQTSFLEAVQRIDRLRDTDRRKRFHERRRLDARLAQDTLADLIALSTARTTPEDQPAADEPLLAAARLVGQACGIAIREPAVAATSHTPLEAIIEASGARMRQITLPEHWWLKDQGPILAYLGDGSPVALLPKSRSVFRRPGYLLRSGTGPAVPVDARAAATVAPTAWIFYAPLPEQATTRELLWRAVRPESRALKTALLAGVGTALLGMLTPQATKVLFEYAVPDANRSMLWQVGLMLLAAATGGLLFDMAQAVSIQRLMTSTSAALHIGVWDRLLRQSPSFFRKFTAGDLENRSEAMTRIRFALNETVIATMLGSLVVLLNLGLMLAYSLSLGVVALGIIAVIVIVDVLAARRMIAITRPLQELEGQLTGLMVQLINAVGKLRTAGAETRAFAQWARTYGRKVKLKQDLQVVNDRVRLMGLALPPIGMALLFGVAYRDIFAGDGSLTLGTFVAFSVAFGMFLAGATALGDNLAIVLNAATLWGRMAPILDTKPELSVQQNSPGVLTGKVRLDHVTFRYRDDGPLTLDDVTIEADAGECIALVGPSGSGKSTIINLLLRFEVPAAGAVYYDDHDLASLDVLAVRRQLGVVTQENKILAGAIYDNIACGSLAKLDDVWAAAKAAGLDEEIRAMPMGMHTYISEGGGNVSGGQRQRLLIARALLQKPRIIILDEATSALDNRTQAIVTDSMNSLKVTRIVVAHRLSTIRYANRIYVIQAGRVVQKGTFTELMQQDGLFQRMMARQVA